MSVYRANLLQIWLAIMALVIALLGFNAGQSYRALQELIENENRANTTKSVLRSIKEFYSAVQEAELGVRGYFLTEDESYLSIYFDSLDQIRTTLLLLKGYDYRVAGQAQRLAQLEELVVTHLSDMASFIEVRQSLDSRADSTLALSTNILQSHQWMQQFGAIVDDMESREYDLLEKQSRLATSSRESVFLNLMIATLVGVGLVLLIGVLVHRAMRYQQQETQRLERMVQERTLKLEQYSSELQRSNRELQDFAFVASHDLQEPLRKIRAFGDRLQSSYAEALGDGADYVQRMQKAADRMSRLVQDLLAFSRVSTSPNPFEPVALDDVVDEVLENLELKIADSGARIERDPLPRIEADASQMRQLLQNLLLNALKFVPPEVRPHIQIRCRELSPAGEIRQYQLQVCDNGIGIDPAYADKIFQPFQRLHGRDQYEGTGIGLAICRRIVERHGGAIDVISAAGEGARFVITLPATQTSRLSKTGPTETEA